MFNRYVFFLAVAGLMSSISLFLVMTKIDPYTDETLGLVLFFLSLFFSVSSILSLIGYFLRMTLYRDELFLNHFNLSLRQGIILGICVCALMGLQVLRTLTWWNGLVIVLISFLIEIYFVAQE